MPLDLLHATFTTISAQITVISSRILLLIADGLMKVAFLETSEDILEITMVVLDNMTTAVSKISNFDSVISERKKEYLSELCKTNHARLQEIVEASGTCKSPFGSYNLRRELLQLREACIEDEKFVLVYAT
ncbi:hypothetical protein D9757_011429 [Collybiopsis confluens]|uniref:Uncharacterized protein n=1 Tax=Collybiopsis confluens TaxID=2823264 RepID=A0A8H5GHF4_9AGAR|nr:hypothetical protein D9757_011429 [Collybiopsis confluens]